LGFHEVAFPTFQINKDSYFESVFSICAWITGIIFYPQSISLIFSAGKNPLLVKQISSPGVDNRITN